MNNLDDLAWKREFDRVEANQEKRKSKREGWDGRTHALHGEQKRYVDFCGYKLMEKNNNEINNQ